MSAEFRGRGFHNPHPAQDRFYAAGRGWYKIPEIPRQFRAMCPLLEEKSLAFPQEYDMIKNEVIKMEEPKRQKAPQVPEDPYIPRPWWQVAGAWLGLGLFIVSAVLLYLYVLRLL